MVLCLQKVTFDFLYLLHIWNFGSLKEPLKKEIIKHSLFGFYLQRFLLDERKT